MPKNRGKCESIIKSLFIITSLIVSDPPGIWPEIDRNMVHHVKILKCQFVNYILLNAVCLVMIFTVGIKNATKIVYLLQNGKTCFLNNIANKQSQENT